VGFDVHGRYGLNAVERVIGFDELDDPVGTEEENTLVDGRSSDSAVYSSIEVQLVSSLTANGGVRGAHYSAGTSGGVFESQARNSNDAAGFGGFRQPTLSDRYFKGVTGRGEVTGNPDLDPESSLQFDFAARYSLGATKWGFYTYRYRIDDLIERYEDGDDQFFFRNGGRANLKGVELEFLWQPAGPWTVQVGGQIARGRIVENGTAMDDIPSDSIDVTLKRRLFERGYVQARGAAFARDERTGPNEIVVPGYGILDLSAGWRFNGGLHLRVQLRNLLDKDYPVSPDRRAVFAPGRSVLANLSLELGR
jgi:outer membrane receptor protein involved in Fe transport